MQALGSSAHRACAMMSIPPGGPVGVGRMAGCLSSSRHRLVDLLCAGTAKKVDSCLCPSHTSNFPMCVCVCVLVWKKVARDRAMIREFNECFFCLKFLGGRTDAGAIHVHDVAFSPWVVTYKSILPALGPLKRPDNVAVGDGAVSKLLAGRASDYVLLLPESQAPTGKRCTVQQIARSSTEVCLGGSQERG